MITYRLLSPISLAGSLGKSRITIARPARTVISRIQTPGHTPSLSWCIPPLAKGSIGIRSFSTKGSDIQDKTTESTKVAAQDRKLESSITPPKNLTQQTSNASAASSIYTVPNILTFTRIVSAPFIGYFIVNGNYQLALSLFSYSCITDFIDGYIARKWNLKSVLGSIIDPLADKLLMTVCTLSLAYINSIPTLVASLIIGRDVMLSFMSFYFRYKTLPPPKTLGKFLNISKNETISVHPNLLGKINTGLQMLYIGGLVFKPVVEDFLLTNLDPSFQAMGILVSMTTVLSGLSYVVSNKSVKFLK